MSPSSGQILIPMAIRIARQAFKKASTLIRTKAPSTTLPTTSAELQPILARNTPRQPIHPAAVLRQSKGRWYTTHSTVNSAIRRFTSSAKVGVKYDRLSFPKSTIGNAVLRLPHRAPFASTLRPNLTGGALPRTAGGYAIGGGAGRARFFSHTPAAPAQVVNNVSAAMRAFWLSGQKAQFDGIDAKTGEKRFKAVTALQDETGRKMRSIPRATPGSFIEFHVNPTVTALTPLSGFAPTNSQDQKTLNTEGLLDVLSVDFARALKDLAAIFNDLKRLAVFGDLTLTMSDKSTIQVHFPGCDAETVESLCDEVGVERGIVHQDEGFDAFVGTEVALLFPFAPSQCTSDITYHQGKQIRDDVDWKNMLSQYEPTLSPRYSTRSEMTNLGFENVAAEETNPWLTSSPSGYSSLHASDDEGDEAYYFDNQPSIESAKRSVSDYEGLEGIYRFLEQCETARRRLEGSCQCAGVVFTLQSHTPVPYQLCACGICRKVGGYNGSVNLGGINDTLQIHKGAHLIKKYTATKDQGTPHATPCSSERNFCSNCSTMLWLWDENWPDLIHPFASAIDSDLSKSEEMVCVMGGSKPGWVRWPEGMKEVYEEYGEESIEGWHRKQGKWIE